MQDALRNSAEIKRILNAVKSKTANTIIGGVDYCFTGILYSFLASHLKTSVIIVTSSGNIFPLHSEISGFKELFNLKAGIFYYPEDDSLIYHNIKSSKDISRVRAGVYRSSFEKKRKILITDINALAEKIPGPAEVKKYFLKLRRGGKLNPASLVEMLEDNGYERAVKVEDVFEYSVRGSIIDMFPPDHEYPLRIELFGDEIESLRFFSLDTYSTTKIIEAMDVLIYNPSRRKAHPSRSCSILDYFSPEDTFVVIDDTNRIKGEITEKISKIEKYIENEETKTNLFPVKGVFRKTAAYKKLRTSPMKVKNGLVNFRLKMNPPFKRDIDRFIDYLSETARKGMETYIVSDNEGETKHLKEIIGERNKELKEPLLPGIKFADADISRGCVIPEINTCIISNREVFERYKGKVLGRVRDKNLRPVKHYMELSAGDYVVHREHGIGVFDGVKTLAFDSKSSDFILVKYAGDDKLYIPVYNISLIDKYVGSESIPALSKLGTSAWRRTKEEIEKELRRMAQELLDIYAKRKVTGGISFPEDDATQKSFEDAFIYEETNDQARAIDDVKNDMSSNRQMDRLVCGDAGFGKTEVAMRAAFKAVNYGKQALVLTATTLLAQQHYYTFRERMADYPVKVEMLSRLTKPKDKKRILKELSEGKTDILIGTHAVLSDRVRFADPGLVVIDEEQHFGVKAKDNLRKKYPNADVVTLTATPIPRTLYFSLSGIRNISVINTPPPGKKAIETYTVEEKLSVAKEIILREVLRRGQVFYVHNNIRTIHKLEEILKDGLPEVRFRAAHGRMKKSTLERIMLDFLAGKFDVLITTTIIESGLDMPNVNTIIISSAEKFGLSQLYQLRGRVGRRDKNAYAYLMVKDPYLLSDTARERLKTIESYVDPGAGFRIAMKDLELRGAGSILGVRQHGNMEKIGFELYCKMLEEAVDRLTGTEFEEEKDTRIKTDFKAYIPEDYIWDGAEKIRIYRRLFGAKKAEDVTAIEKEMTDIWGKVPPEARGIIAVGGLKAAGRKVKADEIRIRGGIITFTWKVKKEMNPRLFDRVNAPVKINLNSVEVDIGERNNIFKFLKEL